MTGLSATNPALAPCGAGALSEVQEGLAHNSQKAVRAADLMVGLTSKKKGRIASMLRRT
ncbi:MAG: hypothetical protein KGH64_00290 [Candidatus Micrarchaeota archaeon]|nr:hypothetical protein [Candidatus Micrarchaeota archaeon]MDE1833754.1 hypothetical protein [Candidatus Micrarchaeota archaeon]MDE1859935.1 hypothetical protein [Candidatus Micrarchaeota archaeon]